MFIGTAIHKGSRRLRTLYGASRFNDRRYDQALAYHAYAKQFEQAIEVERLALEAGARLQRDLQPLQKRLDLYSSGKPYRSRAMVSKHCTNSGWINADVTKCNHCGGNSDA